MPQSPSPANRSQQWWALGLLAFINLLNYLDRNVIFALFESIKRDLSLTDTQLGWLGAAYILVFSVAALPFGVISDVKSRKAVIAGGTALFSIFTALGGLVTSFTQLFVTRAAVGIGEAAYGPASTSMVADYFPGRNRAFSMGVLAAGVPVGGVLGILLGGYLEGIYGWRVALMTVGLPGLFCAAMVSRLVDPRARGSPAQLPPRGAAARDRRPRGDPPALSAAGLHRHRPGRAYLMSRRYGTESRMDAAIAGAAIGLGAILTIWRWVRLCGPIGERKRRSLRNSKARSTT